MMILTLPYVSLIYVLLMVGYILVKKNAEMSPAKSPTVIAAPILLLVPAIDPYMMAPVIVPTNDPLTPILPFSFIRMFTE